MSTIKGVLSIHISHPYIYLVIHRSCLSPLGIYGFLSSVHFLFPLCFRTPRLHFLSNYLIPLQILFFTKGFALFIQPPHTSNPLRCDHPAHYRNIAQSKKLTKWFLFRLTFATTPQSSRDYEYLCQCDKPAHPFPNPVEGSGQQPDHSILRSGATGTLGRHGDSTFSKWHYMKRLTR